MVYSIFMRPEGSTYVGEKVPFVSGAPLPVTDLVVNPVDGAFYFTIGGRRTQSGLYRVTYEGDEVTTPALPQTENAKERQIRRELEAMHYANSDGAVAKAWPYLNHEDRAIRFAARIAIEHQPVAEWKSKALGEQDIVARTYAIIALARSAERDPALMKQAVDALLQTPWSKMDEMQKVDLMRALALCFIRLAPAEGDIDPGNPRAGDFVFDGSFSGRDLSHSIASSACCLRTFRHRALRHEVSSCWRTRPRRKNRSTSPTPCERSRRVGPTSCGNAIFSGSLTRDQRDVAVLRSMDS